MSSTNKSKPKSTRRDNRCSTSHDPSTQTTDSGIHAWGRITIEPLRKRLKNGIKGHRYVWRPGPRLQSELPPGFKLTMVGMKSSRGGPTIFVADKKSTYFKDACAGGLGILSILQNLDGPNRFSYRIMSLVFQRSVHFREHLARTFTSVRDLAITTATDDLGSTILPDELGCSTGRSWTIDDLLKAGRELVPNRSGRTQDLIRLGLWQDAQNNPIRSSSISEKEAFTLVRLGLFDLPSGTDVTAEQKDLVIEHFLDAVKKHDKLKSLPFRKWFFGNHNNILRGISKRAAVRNSMDQETVRAALLELTIDAHRYVASCVDSIMHMFLLAMPVPLSPEEEAIFRGTYCKQRHFGGLTLAMLAARYRFATEAFDHLLVHPNDEHAIGALLRLLSHYSQMCSKRRAADRFRKAKPRPRPKPRGLPKRRKPDQIKLTEMSAKSQPWNPAVLDILRQRQSIACKCGSEQGWHSEMKLDASKKRLIIDDGCKYCESTIAWNVTIREYRRAEAEWAGVEP